MQKIRKESKPFSNHDGSLLPQEAPVIIAERLGLFLNHDGSLLSSLELTPWAIAKRAHVVSLMPLLWRCMQVQHRVWPEAGPNAYLEAMSREATVIPDLLHEENTAYAIPWSACSFS